MSSVRLKALLFACVGLVFGNGISLADEAKFETHCASCHGSYGDRGRRIGIGGDLRAVSTTYSGFECTVRGGACRRPPMPSFDNKLVSNDDICSLYQYLISEGMAANPDACRIEIANPAPPPAPNPSEMTPAPEEGMSAEPSTTIFDPMAFGDFDTRRLSCRLWERAPVSTHTGNTARYVSYELIQSRKEPNGWWLRVPITACDWIGRAGEPSAEIGQIGVGVVMKLSEGPRAFNTLTQWDALNYFELASSDNLDRTGTVNRDPSNPRVSIGGNYARDTQKTRMIAFREFFQEFIQRGNMVIFTVQKTPNFEDGNLNDPLINDYHYQVLQAEIAQ